MIKKVVSSLIAGLLICGASSFANIESIAAPYKLTSFDSIRNIEISEAEKEADIINFDEFLRVYYYNHLVNKSEQEKNKTISRLNKDISRLKYSSDNSQERQTPVILHWTDADNAIGVIKTLFQERKGMKEGIIGVDYVVSEPLLHPDYPERKARSYTIKFSRSSVATTWYHVPEKNMSNMGYEDRKYNKAINIEIIGWRFLQNKKGKNNGMGKYGKMGIREDFDNNFENFDDKYSVYPTVIKLLNYLAEKHNFSEIIDNYSSDLEIDQNIKASKGLTYLNGPVSQYIKGHGLVAIEHTLKYGGDYINMRHDFTPNELLVVYQDLKNYRKFLNENDRGIVITDMLASQIESDLENRVAFNQSEIDYLKNRISQVENISKKEYLLYALQLKTETINSIEKISDIRKNIDYLEIKDQEKIMSNALVKFFTDSQDIKSTDYDYLKVVIDSVRNKDIRESLDKTLTDKYVYRNK